MPNCSADKGLKAIPIRGVSESPPGWSSICNLGHCSRLEHSLQSRRRSHINFCELFGSHGVSYLVMNLTWRHERIVGTNCKHYRDYSFAVKVHSVKGVELLRLNCVVIWSIGIRPPR